MTTYPELLTTINRLLDGDEVSASDIPAATLMQLVALGERRVYRDVRSRHNEKAFSSVTVSSNLATIPDDWEATSVIHFGKEALIPKPEDWIREYLETAPSGDCKYFAEAGSSFYFAPTVANGTAVQGRYFYRYPDLTAANIASNTLLQKEPDLFIYASLCEAAEFYPVGTRIPTWEAKYRRIVDGLNAAKNRAAYSGGRIQRTPSTVLMG